MKRAFIHMSFLIFLVACKNRHSDKPVWVNATDTLQIPGTQIEFKATNINWSVKLLTATQPIQLSAVNNHGQLLVNMIDKMGITEGPAQLCVYIEEDYFFYPVYLLNTNAGTVIHKEFRSPKTVNPDSSLKQQRIIYNIDKYRNILYKQNTSKYFNEAQITLAPKAGVYRAVKEEALSSYYMQPGSCTAIPIASVYKNEKACYCVTAGPLKDKYNNTVADGTLVAFVYTDQQQTYRMEASLLGGFVTVIIPAQQNKTYKLKAFVNETVSKQINLVP